MTAKPLLSLVIAEQRLKAPVPRDLNERPFMLGEGVIYWTEERVLKLKQENEALRKRRRK